MEEDVSSDRSLEDEGDEESSPTEIYSGRGVKEHGRQRQMCAFPPPILLQDKSPISSYDLDEDVVPASRRPSKRKVDEAVEGYPASKKINSRRDEYSSLSQKMMMSMGYVPGKGLGKHGTGIAEPISESMHKGRRGLGFNLDGLEKEDVEWEFEEVYCEGTPQWLTCPPRDALITEDFTGWMYITKRKTSIEDESLFCDPTILKKILEGKRVFDKLSEKEFLDSRLRSNPFETIKGVIFQNRAAMKMANIDAVFDFMFTQPKKAKPNDLLYFADICAGPGGFSEYVLWRRQWHAKGFGFTLKDPESGSDFKLDNFLAAPCESFDPHYGVGGYDGDGDITITANIEAFRDYVMECTDNQGVHFVMADGGISVEGQENIQELLTKQLVLCQYMCAMAILRRGGQFVCKVFDMFTPFSMGLFYLLYCCFEEVCLFKPVTSRPANSESVMGQCVGHIYADRQALYVYMGAINHHLNMLKEETPHLDLMNVVPQSVLEDDPEFMLYVTAFNDSFGIAQIMNLKKLTYFIKNTNLQDNRQTQIRKKCLKLWKVPNIPRKAPSELSCAGVFSSFVDPSSGIIPDEGYIVDYERCDVQVWELSSTKPNFKASTFKVELPKETILEVELVTELTGEGTAQRKQNVLHIFDVICVNGKPMDQKSFSERKECALKLCKSVNKPSRGDLTMLKSKTFFRVADLEREFSRLKMTMCKGHHGLLPTINIRNEEILIAPQGVIFFRLTKDPWHMHLSKHDQQFYFYNGKSKKSTYVCPSEAMASFTEQFLSRHLWRWNDQKIIRSLCSDEVDIDSHDLLTRSILCKHIKRLLEI